MADKDIPHAIWSGSFHVFGIELTCHTLSNGQRVVESDSVHKFMDALTHRQVSTYEMDKAMRDFVVWQRGKANG